MRLVLCVVAALGWIVLAEEEGQQGRCSSNQYSCHSSASCIPIYWLCDGYKDCPYGDDEDYCATTEDLPTTYGCADNQYQCTFNGNCIPQSWVCDGYKDCPYYGDDEESCATTYYPTTTNECTSNEYQCAYDGKCIPQYYVCDGHKDCPYYGDDENNCHTHYFTTTTTDLPPSECPSTFDYIYDRCVLVNPFIISNWDEARYFCQKFGSDIVIVDDFNFYSKLLHYIINKGLDTHDYWVGARDQQEGVWRWVDSSPVHVGAPLWALFGCNDDYHLEPRQSDAQDQDCGFMDRDRGMYMNDASCDQHFAVICQSHGTKTETEEDTKAEEPTVIEEVKKARNDHGAAMGKEEEVVVEESNEEKEEE